jgi:hypothetical protein
MSGAPIIRNDNPVGAVSCICMNDLGKRYGMAVETILEAAGRQKTVAENRCFLLLQDAGLHNIYVEVFLRNRLTMDENVIKI